MKGALGVALAARSYRDGRAIRSSLYRHRRLVEKPLALVFWQLGAEPFATAAIGWGGGPKHMERSVAGDPRNRDFAFAALLDLARWFIPRFEAPGAKREDLKPSKSGRERTRATSAPQLIVPNTATIELIGRLGRRLAYLPTDGKWAADPLLPQLGRHFQFIASHARMPGQQLIVALDELVRDHWVTPQSALERASLAALDAYVEPPSRQHGFAAAAAAELTPVGPVPGDEDEALAPLVDRLNQSRGQETSRKALAKLMAPIEEHYSGLLERTWALLWRVWARERQVEEAPSVLRRWDADRDEYTRHMDFVEGGFRRRTRQSAKQAAEHLRRLENAQKLLETEQACDDPVRMIPYLLDHKALSGTVIEVDREHKELATKRMCSRPLVTIQLDRPCLMPIGKSLWWTECPKGPEFEVRAVEKSTVVLKCTTPGKDQIPAEGTRAVFSVLNVKEYVPPALPDKPPWSHAARVDTAPADIEER